MEESDPEFEAEYQAELKRIKLQKARDKARLDSEDPSEQFVMVIKLDKPTYCFPIRIKYLGWGEHTVLNGTYDLHIPLGEADNGNYFYPADIESVKKIESYLQSRS